MLVLYLSLFYLARGNVISNVINNTIDGNVEGTDYLKSLQEEYPGFGTEWIPVGITDAGQLIIGELTSTVDDSFDLGPVLSEFVYFLFYDRNTTNGKVMTTDSMDDIENYFDKTKRTTFVIHGWMTIGRTNPSIRIKDEILNKYDQNVFIVDWGLIAMNGIYPIPAAAVDDVGKKLAIFINKLIDIGVKAKDIHLVGHSLGAHVSGFAGRKVKGDRIGRITGLDPALPGFLEGGSMGRLNKDDADFVDVIHTSSGILGIAEPIGHADVYPNGGVDPQPGCESNLMLSISCSHNFSWKLYAYSLFASEPMIAYRCQTVDDPSPDECKKNGVPIGDPMPSSARGTYYLKTDDDTNEQINGIDEVDIERILNSSF